MRDKKNKKNTVTAGILLTVTAVIICVVILVGGIGSESDIGDIFTSDEHEENAPSSGAVITSCDYSDSISAFETDEKGDIILTYSYENRPSRRLKFMFDESDKLVRIMSLIGEGEFVTIAEYGYSETGLISEKRYYRDGVTAEFTFSRKENRDGSGTLEVKRLDSDSELMYSEYYQWNRKGDNTLYKLFDENGEQISGYQKSFTRDSDDNITEIITDPSGADSMKTVYRYDEHGSVIYAAVYKKDLITAVTTYTYEYNQDGLADSVTESTQFSDGQPDQVLSTRYAYDKNGNTVSKTVTDAAQDILFTGSYSYENGYISLSSETDSYAGTNITYAYRYADGSEYQRMKTVEKMWDIREGSLSDDQQAK